VPAGLPADISVVKKKDLKLVLFKESFKRDGS